MSKSLQSVKLRPALYKIWHTPIEVVVINPTALSNKNKNELWLTLSAKFQNILRINFWKAYKSVKFFSFTSSIGKFPINLLDDSLLQ